MIGLTGSVFVNSAFFPHVGECKLEDDPNTIEYMDHHGVYNFIFQGNRPSEKPPLQPKCAIRLQYATLLGGIIEALIWLHEGAHAVLGHAKFCHDNIAAYPRLMELPAGQDHSIGWLSKLWLKQPEPEEKTSIYSIFHCFEFEADRSALAALLTILSRHEIADIPRTDAFRLVHVGVLLYFWMQMAIWHNRKMKDGITHPHPLLRGLGLISKLEEHTHGGIPSEIAKEILGESQSEIYLKNTRASSPHLQAAFTEFEKDLSILIGSGWFPRLNMFNQYRDMRKDIFVGIETVRAKLGYLDQLANYRYVY